MEKSGKNAGEKKNSIIRLNIKARQDIPEFLTAHIYQYILSHWTMDKDWSWNIFSLHNFFSMLIEQLINLKEVKSENLNLGQIFKIK